jgi:hypothetical protein
MFRDTRTTGVVPQPLGACPMGACLGRDVQGYVAEALAGMEVQEALAGLRVQPALAGYTRGSFAPRSPWAVPGYVAKQPTGVDGVGLGQDADCAPFDAVKNAIAKGLSEAASEIGAGQDMFRRGLIESELPKLAGEITERLQALARTASGAQARLSDLLAQAVGDVVGGVPVIGSVLKSFSSVIISYGSKYILDIAQICEPTTAALPAPTGWKEYEPVTVTAAEFRAMQQQVARQAAGLGPISAVAQALTAPKALRLIKPPAPPAPEAAPGKIPTPVIIGAAALAALMLLK